eukprot:GHVP01027533.1.p1 GENE.GHVP01027533.1~~GHVP01027533.1.p1  ORF type:complete len:1575 (-),score=308.39 GHVP01027533.1:1421-6145(-)
MTCGPLQEMIIFFLYALISDNDLYKNTKKNFRPSAELLDPDTKERQRYTFMDPKKVVGDYMDVKRRLNDTGKPDVIILLVSLSPTDTSGKCFEKFPPAIEEVSQYPLLIFKCFDPQSVRLLTLGAKVFDGKETLADCLRKFVSEYRNRLSFVPDLEEFESLSIGNLEHRFSILEECSLKVCHNIRRVSERNLKKLNRRSGDVIIVHKEKEEIAFKIPRIDRDDLERLELFYKKGLLPLYASHALKYSGPEALLSPTLMLKNKKCPGKSPYDFWASVCSGSKINPLQDLQPKQDSKRRTLKHQNADQKKKDAIKVTSTSKKLITLVSCSSQPEITEIKKDNKNDGQVEEESSIVIGNGEIDSTIESKNLLKNNSYESNEEIPIQISIENCTSESQTKSFKSELLAPRISVEIESPPKNKEKELLTTFIFTYSSEAIKPVIKRLLSKLERNPTAADQARMATYLVDMALEDLQKNISLLPTIPMSKDSLAFKWQKVFVHVSELIKDPSSFVRQLYQEIHNAVTKNLDNLESKFQHQFDKINLEPLIALRYVTSIKSIAACEVAVALHFEPFSQAPKALQSLGSALCQTAKLSPPIGKKDTPLKVGPTVTKNCLILSLLLMMLGKSGIEDILETYSGKRFLETTVRKLTETLTHLMNIFLGHFPGQKSSTPTNSSKNINSQDLRFGPFLLLISDFFRDLLTSPTVSILIPRDFETLLQSAELEAPAFYAAFADPLPTPTANSRVKEETLPTFEKNFKAPEESVDVPDVQTPPTIAVLGSVVEADAIKDLNVGITKLFPTEIVDLRSKLEKSNQKTMREFDSNGDGSTLDLNLANSGIKQSASYPCVLSRIKQTASEHNRVSESETNLDILSISSGEDTLSSPRRLISNLTLDEDLETNSNPINDHFSFRENFGEIQRRLRTRVDKEEPRVLRESESWLVLYKPAFWHCSGPGHHSGRLTEFKNPLYEFKRNSRRVDLYKSQSGRMGSIHLWLMKEYPDFETIIRWSELECGLCHRIDLETSGSLLVAKSRRTREALWSQFRKRNVYKEYLLLCHGRIEAEKGVVQTRLLTRDFDSKSRIRSHFTQVVAEGGDDALTEYTVCRIYRRKPWAQIKKGLQDFPLTIGEHLLEEPMSEPEEKFCRFKNQSDSEDPRLHVEIATDNDYGVCGEATADEEFTLCKCRIVTGRTHQIRVHMRHIGHPLVSDNKYLDNRKRQEDRKWCKRMFLHAAKLQFHDPDAVENDLIEVICPLSPELVQAMDLALEVVEDLQPLNDYGIKQGPCIIPNTTRQDDSMEKIKGTFAAALCPKTAISVINNDPTLNRYPGLQSGMDERQRASSSREWSCGGSDDKFTFPPYDKNPYEAIKRFKSFRNSYWSIDSGSRNVADTIPHNLLEDNAMSDEYETFSYLDKNYEVDFSSNESMECSLSGARSSDPDDEENYLYLLKNRMLSMDTDKKSDIYNTVKSSTSCSDRLDGRQMKANSEYNENKRQNGRSRKSQHPFTGVQLSEESDENYISGINRSMVSTDPFLEDKFFMIPTDLGMSTHKSLDILVVPPPPSSPPPRIGEFSLRFLESFGACH